MLHSAMKKSDATFSHCNCYSTKIPPEQNVKNKISEFQALAISFNMVIIKWNFKAFVMQNVLYR